MNVSRGRTSSTSVGYLHLLRFLDWYSIILYNCKSTWFFWMSFWASCWKPTESPFNISQRTELSCMCITLICTVRFINLDHCPYSEQNKTEKWQSTYSRIPGQPLTYRVKFLQKVWRYRANTLEEIHLRDTTLAKKRREKKLEWEIRKLEAHADTWDKI